MTTEPIPNLPLLRKALAHIDAHPDEWAQSSWATRTAASSCGTAFCLAGHAVAMSGGDLHWDELSGLASDVTMPGGSPMSIQDAARDALGLTGIEAHYLFAIKNSRAGIQFIAEAIADRAGEWL